MRLFGRFKQRTLYAKFGQARINIHAALPAIKFRFAGFHDTAGRLRALGSGGVNFRRINIIAHAMDHSFYIGQLRMIVNNFANDLQEQNAVRVNLGLNVPSQGKRPIQLDRLMTSYQLLSPYCVLQESFDL